jgi:hypothetical protein
MPLSLKGAHFRKEIQLMRITRAVLCIAVALGVVLPSAAPAQEQKKANPGTPAMPPAPKPGPEHAGLKQSAGTWDATIEAMWAPGTPPTVSKGVETSSVGMGGLWLVTDYKGEFMKEPFQGHGVTGYDPAKKKYVSTWVDSMSSALSIGESTYDPAKKTMTGSIEGADTEGKPSKMRAVTEWKDDNTRVFTMYATGPDGKEAPAMRITYKRRK